MTALRRALEWVLGAVYLPIIGPAALLARLHERGRAGAPGPATGWVGRRRQTPDQLRSRR